MVEAIEAGGDPTGHPMPEVSHLKEEAFGWC